MKSNPTKKPRKQIALIQTAQDIGGGTISFDKESGKISIHDAQGNPVSTEGLSYEHFYEGESRSVKLSRLVAGPKPLNGLSDLDFLATYDLVYIIDTNTLEKDGETHHITSFVRCRILDWGDSYHIDLYERVGYFHFVNLTHESFEKVGWCNLFHQDFFKEDLAAGLKIGVVVDSYYDQLDGYNKRSEPILNKDFLPNGVTVMHATANKNDTLVNRLMRTADSFANEYKEKILAGETGNFPPAVTFFDCEKYWFVNQTGLTVTPNTEKKTKVSYGPEAWVELEMYGDGDNLIQRKKII